jgi:hypothetical protein
MSAALSPSQPTTDDAMQYLGQPNLGQHRENLKRIAVYEEAIRNASAALRKASLTDNERIADAQIALNRACVKGVRP